MEKGAFILLGSIAITMIVFAAENALEFSENRDEIAAALSSHGAVVDSGSGSRDTRHVLTNVTVVPALGRGTPVEATSSGSHQS
jgi:hypothetical protein